MLIHGRVGEQIAGDGDERGARLAKSGALVTADLGGRWLELAKRGRVFSQAVTPLGLALPIYTATALVGGVPIWNTAGSDVDVEILEVGIGYGSGTADFGSVGWMARKFAGDLATGAVLSAFAEVAPMNALFGAGEASKVKSSNAGTVTATAGVAGDWMRTMFSINLEAATGVAHGTLSPIYKPEGTIIHPPGTFGYIAATKASVAIYATHVVWAEHPRQ